MQFWSKVIFMYLDYAVYSRYTRLVGCCSRNIKLSSIFPLILCLFIFQIRNNFFRYLHLLLEVVVYGEFSYEVFGFSLDMGASSISLCIPYVLLAVKSFLFYLCCSRDPGSQMNNCPISIKINQIYVHLIRVFFWRHIDKGKPYCTSEGLPVWWKTVPAGIQVFNLSAGQTCTIQTL